MLLVAIVLLLQLGVTSSVGFRIEGTVVSGTERVRVDLILKDSMGATVATTQSFANGAFHFDGVRLGIYSISIVDARYNLIEFPVLLREPKDFERKFVVNLTRNGEPSPDARPAVEIAVNIDEIAERVPREAVDEFKKGVEALRSREKENPADAHFKKAISIAPEFYEAHLQLGLHQKNRRQNTDAIATLERAASLRPVAPRPLTALGQLYVDDGQFQKAIDTFVKAAQLGPLDADDRFHLGNAFYKLDKPAAAEQQFKQALSLAPGKNPAVYLQLHNVYMKTGRPQEGLQILEEFLRLCPGAADFKALSDRAKKLRDLLKKG